MKYDWWIYFSFLLSSSFIQNYLANFFCSHFHLKLKFFLVSFSLGATWKHTVPIAVCKYFSQWGNPGKKFFLEHLILSVNVQFILSPLKCCSASLHIYSASIAKYRYGTGTALAQLGWFIWHSSLNWIFLHSIRHRDFSVPWPSVENKGWSPFPRCSSGRYSMVLGQELVCLSQWWQD